MSNNQQDNGVAAIGVGLGFIFLVFFVVAMFVAGIFTLIAIIALFHAIHLGSVHIERERAFMFIARGVIGGLVLAGFIFFFDLLILPGAAWDGYFKHLWLVGYTIGSLGMEIANYEEGAYEQTYDYTPPSRAAAPQAPAIEYLPTQQSDFEPFHFAEWADDEASK